jgi:hypothetical protein
MFGAPGCPIAIYQRNRLFDQSLGQFKGIGNRGGSQDE